MKTKPKSEPKTYLEAVAHYHYLLKNKPKMYMKKMREFDEKLKKRAGDGA